MKLPKRFKLHALADQVLFTGTSLEATDGVCHAFVPVSPVGDTGTMPVLSAGDNWAMKLIPAAALKEATQGTKGDGRLDLLAGVVAAARAPGAPELRCDTESVPLGTTAQVPWSNFRTGRSVCIDPVRLLALAQALGAEDGVRLYLDFYDDGKCRSVIYAEPTEVTGPVGTIMPIVKDGQ